MVWTGDPHYRLAPALLTLLHQLEAAYPGQQWVTSPQTGTIGDVAHQAENSSSDHNPWLDRTVRALDIAANVTGVTGIASVTDAPDCEALFGMVNRMYAAKDPRVWPDGYGIYLRRVTDWNNPGGYHAQVGDPHLYHLHISVSQNPAGYNSPAPWPLLGEAGSSVGATQIGDNMSAAEVAEIKAYINERCNGLFSQIKGDLNGTKLRVQQYQVEILGLRKYLRDSFCAVGGQLAALPDGTKISSIGAALLSSNAHTDTVLAAHAGSGGQVDLQPILDELQKLPTDVVAQLAQKLGGAA